MRMRKYIVIGLLVLFFIYGNIPERHVRVVPTATPTPAPSKIPTPTRASGHTLQGTASYYTVEYCRRHNPSCRTASGEVFDDTLYTCACPSFIPLGTTLRVKHLNAVVLVVCNDRGAFDKKYGRLLDLSKAAFEALAPTGTGVIDITVEIVR
jgi:rare lipoprotein A